MDTIADPIARAVPKISGFASQYQRVALVFQGGGALGACQAGVYHALSEANCKPNWVSGVSIGAINAAIVGGNSPENRLPRLRQFWVSGRKLWEHTPDGDWFRTLRNYTSAMMTITMGQPGFFAPRYPGWFTPAGAAGATSYCDTHTLKSTLEHLVDFDSINSQRMRVTFGSVNVRSGNFIYFDNAKETLDANHVTASGALPPALPAIKIDGE
jgi:NTE family protein